MRSAGEDALVGATSTSTLYDADGKAVAARELAALQGALALDAVPAQRPLRYGLVVHRGDSVYVVLNLFPYNPGHVLVCPYRHVADYTDLTPDERTEFGEITRTAMEVLRSVSRPAGFNIGMNQGEVAGAGIAAHLHQHVVPRWGGDANFLPVIAQTRALPQLLDESRRLIADAWAARV